MRICVYIDKFLESIFYISNFLYFCKYYIWKCDTSVYYISMVFLCMIFVNNFIFWNYIIKMVSHIKHNSITHNVQTHQLDYTIYIIPAKLLKTNLTLYKWRVYAKMYLFTSVVWVCKWLAVQHLLILLSPTQNKNINLINQNTRPTENMTNSL